MQHGFFKDREGNPFLMLGIQTCNSSTGDREMLEREILAAKAYHANTLEAPVYWCEVEKSEGAFDFTQVDELLELCRAHDLRLILLWFATSKNGHPNYAPEWVKAHPDVYRLATGPAGAHVASLSPFCEVTMRADAKAFCALMGHLKETDGERATVLAVQVENEMGFESTDMDYSPDVLELYRSAPVPDMLRGIRIEDCGVEPKGDSWSSLFGRYAHEVFSAWGHAVFMNTVAKKGREVYDLPVYINVALQENGFEEAGFCYNAGAAVSRMLDVYKAVAPDIDLICPDMYVPVRERYRRVLRAYARKDNPLMIPESPVSGIANAMNIMEAMADFGCIGMACFGGANALDTEGNLLPEAREVAQTFHALSRVAPLLVRYRGTGRVHAICQQEFMDCLHLKTEKYHVEARFMDGHAHFGMGSRINQRDPANRDILTARGRALLIEEDAHTFYLAGSGVKVNFIYRPDPENPQEMEHIYPLTASRQSGTLNYLSVEEGHFEGDQWVVDRYRCGDEANMALFVHRGEVVRIRLNPNK